MKQKNLLNLGMMLAAGLSANAQTQVFHEGFDAAQTKSPSDVAWYEFINSMENGNGKDERSIDNDNAAAGAGCLSFYNVGPYTDADADTTDVAKHNNWWMRAVKFRNLPLQEGKSYRLTYRFKGSNTWNDGSADNKCKMSVALMQGGENADIALLDPNGKEFRYEISRFNPEDYERYTNMFYFTSEQLQKDTYAKNNPDKDPLEEKFFATFNVYNPGQFFLDEVDLVESSIAGVEYEADVVRVNFGYNTNIKDLVSASPIGRVLMPTDCATVKVNGEDVKVIGVELHNDGYMYVYLDEDNPIDGNEAKVEVAFKNPSDAQYQINYKGNLAPEGAAFDFEGEQGTYLEDLSSNLSYEWTEPELVSITPSDGSFNLPETTSEITLTFDKKVKTTDENDIPLRALLDTGEELEMVTKPVMGEDGTEVGSESLTFRRKDGKTFTKGSYSLSLSGICSAKGIPSMKTFTTNFETGKMQVAETIFEKVGSCTFPDAAAGSIPEGWTVYSDGEERVGGSTHGSGGRTFDTSATQTSKGIYTRANGGEGSVTTAPIALPAGDVELRSFLAFWSSSSDIQVDVLDSENKVVTTAQFTPAVAGEANRNAANFKFEEDNIRFKSEGGDYHLKYTLLTEGYNGMFVGGFDAYTYKVTEGESTDTEIEFEEASFGGAEDNHAPKAESGWSLYQGGSLREPGADFNYNGARIFKLGIQNMSAGYYAGTSGDSYMIYGDGGSDGTAPLLHLKSGRTQVTYYVANWKEKGANAGVAHTATFQLANKNSGAVISDRSDKIVDCDMNGDRNANISAKMVQFIVNVPEEGDYTIKIGANTEMFIGNFKIEKLGSQTAYYLGQIKQARDLALEEYALCEDAQYDGTAKTALKTAIDKYETPDVHTPAEVNAAKEELTNATKNMATRREYITRYETAKTNAATIIAEVGETEEHPATKYAQLDAYKNLDATYQEYAAKAAQELENEDLIAATTSLENNYTWLKNMKDKAIGLLTKQVVDAAALLVKLDEGMGSNEQVIAAGNAITDDQNLANLLKLRVTKAIYDKFVAGEELFATYDAGLDENVADSLNLTSYIQNAGLYTTETNDNKLLNDNANLPGWTIDRISGTPNIEVGWGTFDGSAINPVNDKTLIAGWYCEWDLSQTIKNLPVGKYTYVSGTQDRGFADTSSDKTAQLDQREHWTVEGNIGGEEGHAGEIFSYIYWTVGDKTQKRPFNISGQGQWYDFTDCASTQFDVPAGDNGMGEITIGSHVVEYQAQGASDNFRLYMVGKDSNFDYASASKKIAQDIETGMDKVTAPEGEPVSVAYYDLSGAKVSTPSGIVIKVVTYANGYMEVKKVLVK